MSFGHVAKKQDDHLEKLMLTGKSTARGVARYDGQITFAPLSTSQSTKPFILLKIGIVSATSTERQFGGGGHDPLTLEKGEKFFEEK